MQKYKKCEFVNDSNNNQPPCLAMKDEECPKTRLKRRISATCWKVAVNDEHKGDE